MKWPWQRRTETAKPLIRLSSAVLCASCETIGDSRNGTCTSCGSQALLVLAQALQSNFHCGARLIESKPSAKKICSIDARRKVCAAS